MFKKLRAKFTFLVFIISFFTLLIIFFSINIAVGVNASNRLYEQANKTLKTDQPVPMDMKEMTNRYVLFTKNGDSYEITTNKGFPAQDDVLELSKSIVNEEKQSGYYQNIYFLFSDDKLIALDAKSEIDSARMVFFVSLSVSCSALVVISLSAFFFSKIVIRPYEKLYRSQRRFLTDASHELKTPLSIIQADLDIIDSQLTNSKWVDSALVQTERMKKLILEMITLNKLEELSSSYPKERFDVATSLLEVISSYEGLKEEKDIQFTYQIPTQLFIDGNQELFIKLFSILLDNAFKYVDEHGYIYVSLVENHRKVTFSFENSSTNIDQEKLSHCFDRFYTFDSSRAKNKSGFGIGLSIAKAIVNEHDGEIKAEKIKDDAIRFEINIKK